MSETARKPDWLDWLYNCWPMRLLRVLGPVAILCGVFGYLQDLGDKRAARDAEAWQVLTTKAPGNSGKIEALEYLNSDTSLKIPNPRRWGIPLGPKEDVYPDGFRSLPNLWVLIPDYGPWKTRTRLDGIDLSAAKAADGTWKQGAYLVYVNLAHARLDGAVLSRANMLAANLSGTVFASADLSGANLSWATFNDTQFATANLSGAAFWFAKLSDTSFYKANLSGADFRGADLREATQLTQEQVDSICVDENTTLPKGMKPPVKCQRDQDHYVVMDNAGSPIRVK